MLRGQPCMLGARQISVIRQLKSSYRGKRVRCVQNVIQGTLEVLPHIRELRAMIAVQQKTSSCPGKEQQARFLRLNTPSTPTGMLMSEA